MSASHSDGGDAAPTRRDFLYIATAATGAVAVAVPTWSFVDSMNADASVRALSSIDVDVSEVEVGQQIIVEWRGKPVIIRKRTPDDIEAANAVAVGDLPDQLARNANIDEGADASDANRFVGSEEWLVMIGVCTHLGCVPIGDEGRNGDLASQRRGPTVSPRKTAEKTAISSGLTKKMATASASGRAARPRKKKRLAITTRSPRMR